MADVIIIKLPGMNNYNKKELYKKYSENESVMFMCIDDNSPNMCIVIDVNDIKIIDEIKYQFPDSIGINDDSEIPCSKFNDLIVGNKLLRPRR